MLSEYQGIPPSLQELQRWVLWRYIKRDGKPTKPPYSALTGGLASTTDPATWAPFSAAAAKAAGSRYWNGIGFVFSDTDGLMGVDLDHCVDPATGEIAPWAAEIVKDMNTYTEISPSGEGLHLLFYARLDTKGRKGNGVEFYQVGRYFTMTGRALENGFVEPQARQAEVEEFVARHFPEAPPPAPPAATNGHADSTLAGPDWDVIDRLRKNAKYDALWRGDIQGYPSHSEADIALAGQIAFYAGADLGRIDRLFRQSGLLRDKWDEQHGEGTYGEITIKKVLATKTEYYEWGKRLNSSHSLYSSVKESAPRALFSSHSLYSSTAESSIEAEWPADLAPEAFHGLAGEIVQEIAPETEGDPAAMLINTLLLFGNAVGRKPHTRVLTTRHPANLFAALVGHTGESKGSSWDPIEYVFERALPTYMAERKASGVASGEGMIHFVRDRREKSVQVKDKRSGRMTMDYETQVEDEGVDDKRLLVIEYEMTSLLKVMNRPGNILSEQLRQAWERGDLQNLNKNSPMKATGAHISLLCHITPDALRRHLTEADAANGFANRFIWMACRRSCFLPEGGNLPPLNKAIIGIRELVELASDKIMIERHPIARLMWQGVYEDLRCSGVGMFGEMTARRAPIVNRLSLIYALMDGMSVILPEHLLAALAVWERAEATVRYLFGDATGDPTADALHEAMLARPEGASRTDLHNALGRNRPVADLDRALMALTRAGRATMKRQKGEGGREGEAWYANQRGEEIVSRPYLEKAKAIYKNAMDESN